jgi:hypothetical protein
LHEHQIKVNDAQKALGGNKVAKEYISIPSFFDININKSRMETQNSFI